MGASHLGDGDPAGAPDVAAALGFAHLSCIRDGMRPREAAIIPGGARALLSPHHRLGDHIVGEQSARPELAPDNLTDGDLLPSSYPPPPRAWSVPWPHRGEPAPSPDSGVRRRRCPMPDPRPRPDPSPHWRNTSARAGTYDGKPARVLSFPRVSSIRTLKAPRPMQDPTHPEHVIRHLSETWSIPTPRAPARNAPPSM